jgi:MFS family permease
MTGNLDLKEVESKAYNSINQDGLSELAMGIAFLCMAAFLYVYVFLNEEVTMYIILPAILIGSLLQRMRKKYTYPRVGYADLRSQKRRMVVLILLIAFLLLGIYFFINYNKLYLTRDYFSHTLLFIGLFLSAAYIYRVVHYKINRFIIYAVVAILSLIGTHLFPMRGMLRVLIMFTCLALFQIPIGLIIFFKFLRKYPVLQDETTEN